MPMRDGPESSGSINETIGLKLSKICFRRLRSVCFCCMGMDQYLLIPFLMG